MDLVPGGVLDGLSRIGGLRHLVNLFRAHVGLVGSVVQILGVDPKRVRVGEIGEFVVLSMKSVPNLANLGGCAVRVLEH